MGFVVPKIKRGRITNFRTGLFQTFVYNPASIDERKSANIIIDPIPGDADPLVRWASGAVNEINFDINIDGEGRLRRTGVQLFNGSSEVSEFPLAQADDTFSIAGEIEFFEQFLFPVDPNVRGGTGEPDLVVLTFGRRYQGTLCMVSSLDVSIIEFDTELNPTKAHLKMSLVRRYERSRYADKVWDTPQGIGAASQALPTFPSAITNAESTGRS